MYQLLWDRGISHYELNTKQQRIKIFCLNFFFFNFLWKIGDNPCIKPLLST